ncbi:hypothetical protein Pla22_35060 [Rubripirellula amarantea]|uniref:Uncharacterized protein n=1 Tax=Rubripirellula amarantea TaxID=2527999 RepID=A0A5C5WLA6_9BACT|nr:hypothetical protein [Rubripirellula amarantea]TWT50763.1 hypothetical protein Pla22_35060 [Rubripirellula amarantea]
MLRNDWIIDLTDWLTEPPSGGPFQTWCVGAMLSAVVTVYGLKCCIVQRATTINLARRGSYHLGQDFWFEISGFSAVTFGWLLISVGIFMHFQWFWGNHPRLIPFYEIGKYSAVVSFIFATLAHASAMIAAT